MLVLTRRTGETIVIRVPAVNDPAGDCHDETEITVKVLGVNRGAVKYGIDAPTWVQVDRGEIREAKDQGRRE